MGLGDAIEARRCGAVMRLLLAVVVLGSGAQALAEDCVADLGGVLDGNVTPVPPSQIQIDGVCRIMNYPNGMSTNFSFLTQPGQTDERWIVIFDNVLHTGQMACNAVAGHKIWFVNGSSSTIQQNCQNLLIPVEKIDKAIEAIEEADYLTAEQKRDIFYNNAARFLRLERP